MKSESDNFLDELWSALLSRDASQICSAYNGLNAEERKSILAHLLKMAEEPGWLAEQRISALAALKALSINPKQV